jgi:hypothetical protein
MISQDIVVIGNLPNLGDGDSLLTAFTKVNNNFSTIFDLLNTYGNLPSVLTGQYISTGTLPNDGTGDTLSVAFNKINTNFANLFSIINSYAESPISIQFVDMGDGLNSGSGDTLSSAFNKVNDNFTKFFDILIQQFESFFTIEVVEEPTSFSIEPMSFSSPMLMSVSSFSTSTNSQEIINIGALPNDGTGDPLRTAFAKINNNFTTLFNTSTENGTATTTGNTPGQIIFDTEIANFSSASFTIKSKDAFANSQNIILSAQISNDNSNVSFSAYGTTFIGTPICRFDMDVDGSNLRILCDPLTSNDLTHTIYSQLLIEP